MQRHYSKRKLTWVEPGILVRVISKEYSAGKLYTKKVRVQDVFDSFTFTVELPETGQMFDTLTEDDIETVMPSMEGMLKIVYGEHKGEVGKLLERNKKANKVVVQLSNDEMSIVSCTQDDCSALY